MPSPPTPHSRVERRTCSIAQACALLGCSRNTFDAHFLPALRPRVAAFKRGSCCRWFVVIPILDQLIAEDAARWSDTTGTPHD
jgi:hypothetical protein